MIIIYSYTFSCDDFDHNFKQYFKNLVKIEVYYLFLELPIFNQEFLI